MTDLAPLLDEWGLPGARVERAATGLINETWILDGRWVLQKIHPIFGAAVLDDIEAVTAHLAARGLLTSRLLRTRGGALGATDADGRLWRVMTYIDGHTVERVGDPGLAREAAALVARFHGALADLDWEYRFVRAGVHDTAAHLARLERVLDGDGPRALAEAILREPVGAFAALPRRRAHGDLKISNVRFGDGGDARALIDLDTMGWLPLPFELGDAFRSWCNPLGEDVEATRFDLEIFAAGVEGYASAAQTTAEERDLLVEGVHTIAVELAARFCVDAFEDKYFGWDPKHFPSRREHNRVRAAGQLALARAIDAARSDAEAVVKRAFGAARRG